MLGVDAFERAADVATSEAASHTRFRLEDRGGRGEGEQRSEGFIVFAGATANAAETPSCPDPIRRLRSTLRDKGVLQARSDGVLELVEDYVFSSPSSAAGVLCGASMNGRTHWIASDGRTLKNHQESPTNAFTLE